jgi:hypothetical protein
MSEALYGAFAAPNLSAAMEQLLAVNKERFDETGLDPYCIVQRPVGLLFARGDRGGEGAKLAEQAIQSFPYWDKRSKSWIDFLYVGWAMEDGVLTFSMDAFDAFRNQVSARSDFEYEGETELLLVDLLFKPWCTAGALDFKTAIHLRLEEMLRTQRIGSLDGFIEKLILQAENADVKTGKSPVWVLSDGLGLQKVKRDFWSPVLKLVLRDYAKTAEALADFAIRDLSGGYEPKYVKLSPTLKSREES